MTSSNDRPPVAGKPPQIADWPLPELGLAPAPAGSAVAAGGPTAADLAYERGLREGRSRALEELAARGEQALQSVALAAQALAGLQQEFGTQLEDDLHALSLGVAREIVQREIALDPTIVRNLVRRAVDLVSGESTFEVHLHPEDLAALQDQLEMFDATGEAFQIQWIADDRLGRGDCEVETPQRIVDGRIDHALLALYERMGR